MKNIDNIVFDLDDTLYSYDSNIFYLMNGEVVKYMCNNLKLSEKESEFYQSDLYNKYGTNTYGLIKENKCTNIQKFLQSMHNICLDSIPPNPELSTGLKKLKESGKSLFIYTNATKNSYVNNVLDHLQVNPEIFDGISGTEDTFYIPKPHLESYKLFLESNLIKASNTLFIEDSPRNLLPASSLGMKTMLVLYPETKHKNICENKSLEEIKLSLPYVDYLTTDINSGIKFIINNSRKNNNENVNFGVCKTR